MLDGMKRIWQLEDFDFAEKGLARYLSSRKLFTSSQDDPVYPTVRRSFKFYKIKFGLSYHSHGAMAGYYFNNCYVYFDYDMQWNIEAVVIDKEGQLLLYVMDKNENYFFYPIN